MSPRREKVGHREDPGKHISVRLSLLSLSAVFSRLPLCPSTPLAHLLVSVGVNLSPRLSSNTELYKLKPISLRRGPGVPTRGPLYFRLFVVGKHAWSSSQQPSNRQQRRYPACTPGYTATSRRIPSAYACALIRVSFVCTRRGLRITRVILFTYAIASVLLRVIVCISYSAYTYIKYLTQAVSNILLIINIDYFMLTNSF